MISIRELPKDDPPVDVFEGSVLLPIPEKGTGSILFEERDGKNPLHLTAKSLIWIQGNTTTMSLSKRKIDVWVTDARVAFACVKYEKGRFWWGFGGCGAIFAVVAMIVSATRAAVSRHGKVLVGQIRYPWLGSVGSTIKVDGRGKEALAFTTTLANHVECGLTLTLDSSFDAASTAAEILRRAATYRLASEPDLTVEDKALLEKLAQSQPMTSEPGKGVNHARFLPSLPSPKPVSAESGRS